MNQSILTLAFLSVAAGCFAQKAEHVKYPRDSEEPYVTPGKNLQRPRRNNTTWLDVAHEVQLEWNKAPRGPHGEVTFKEPVTVRPKLVRGDPRDKLVALSFDDGPHDQWTEKLLKILHEENVKATFFLVGEMAQKRPDLVRKIAEEKHELGNHSFSHVTLSNLSPFEMEVEWRAANEAIYAASGITPVVCRPPGGRYNDDVIFAAHRNRMTTVLWTDDPGDYAKISSEVLLKRTLPQIRNGANVLLHSGTKCTVDILPLLIRSLKAKGYQFVTATELSNSRLDIPGDRRNWFVAKPTRHASR